MKGSLPASCQCQLAQVRGHELYRALTGGSNSLSPRHANSFNDYSHIHIYNFGGNGGRVYHQIKFVKGQVTPVENRVGMGEIWETCYCSRSWLNVSGWTNALTQHSQR